MYRVENFNISGSKYLKDKYKKTVKNVTYKSGGTLNGNRDLRPSEREGKKIFKDSVIQYIKQKFGDEYNYTVSDVINNYNREEEFEYLHILQIKFRLGIKNTLLARLILSAKEHDPRLMSKLKGKTEKEIMTYFKVNTKMLKKIDSRNGYSCYNFLVKLFDDVNIIRTTMESMRNLSRIQNYNEPQYKDFYFHYKKHNTAKKISNQIISAQNYTVFDTQSLYAQIKSQMKDYEVDYTKGIKELHDIFSRDLAKLKRANKKIPKNKFIDKVFKNFTHDGIEYRMAKDTDELVRVGAIMDICVGGYRDRALNKDCFIVIGYKDNKPVTCIELNLHANGYRVSQVKKRKNSLAKPSENNALIELLTTHDIDANTYDLDLSYTDRRLKDEDSELLGKIERFTYARNVPEELQEEILIA